MLQKMHIIDTFYCTHPDTKPNLLERSYNRELNLFFDVNLEIIMYLKPNNDYDLVALSSTPKTLSSYKVSHSRRLLERMAENWDKRAQVRQNSPDEPASELNFELSKDDFRLDLLPFKNHPLFLQSSIELQKQVLSCGWIAYSEKTIDIEAKIVTPACNYILYRDLPGVDDGISQQIVSETLVDEAYHILMVVNACNVTRQYRNLESLKLPSFDLVLKMHQEQEKCAEVWQKMLVQLAVAIVSEVFVSDYLDLLAMDNTIQPLNRLTVATHRQDEVSHNLIFAHLAKCLYHHLTAEQQTFFVDVLPKPVYWFASQELRVWQSMLDQIQFSNAAEMLADCAAQAQSDLTRVDYSDLIKLSNELGILDSQQGIDSFSRAGLLAA
jgi:hypothetical protein